MLLTNTINTQTVNITIATGNGVVAGVEFRGCSACPAHYADRPSEKPAAKRISDRLFRRPGRHLHTMYQGDQMSWQELWLDSPTSFAVASGLRLGNASGRSLN